MHKLRSIPDRIALFFHRDFPRLLSRLSLGQKILCFLLSLVLVPLLCIVLLTVLVLPFAFVMSLLTSNETYEFLHPQSDISSVQIIRISEDVDLYNHPVLEIPEILDQRTSVLVSLEETTLTDFWTDFREIQCKSWWNDPIPYIGEDTILILYEDGSREWISAIGTFYHDVPSGRASMTWYYFNQEQFSAFLLKYGYQSP